MKSLPNHSLQFKGEKGKEFALTLPLDSSRRDCALKKVSVFYSKQRPRGAPLFGKKGEFLGMLAFKESEEQRFFLLFLPTHEMPPISVSSR